MKKSGQPQHTLDISELTAFFGRLSIAKREQNTKNFESFSRQWESFRPGFVAALAAARASERLSASQYNIFRVLQVEHDEENTHKPLEQRQQFSEGVRVNHYRRMEPTVAPLPASNAVAVESNWLPPNIEGERDELDTLLNNLSKAVGARVKLANVMRASINQLLNAEEHIVGRGQKARHEFGQRPANSDALALARFEDQLRDVVEAGLVDAARKTR